MTCSVEEIELIAGGSSGRALTYYYYGSHEFISQHLNLEEMRIQGVFSPKSFFSNSAGLKVASFGARMLCSRAFYGSSAVFNIRDGTEFKDENLRG